MNVPPRLRVEGTPAEMGAAVGEELREYIRAFIDVRFDALAAWLGARGGVFRRTAAAAAARASIPHIEAFDPAGLEEFAAGARAAGVAPEDLLVAVSYTDIRDDLRPPHPPGFQQGAPPPLASPPCDDIGCSKVLVAPARSSTEAPLLGQTWDMHASAAPFVMTLERRPRGAPATTALTTPGSPPIAGVSEVGVACGNANVVGRRGRPGVPYLFLVGRALRSASTAEAVEAIVSARRMGCHAYMLADAGGDVRHVECGLEWAAEIRVGGIYVATNHFRAPGLRSEEADDARTGTTCERLDRLLDLADAAPARVSPEEIRRWLDDTAIRRPLTPADPHAVSTCATVVIDVAARSLEVARPT